MPGTKEIRSKIASVKSTQKITKAMEMVAASKMRRAQERMRAARPYAAKMRSRDQPPERRQPGLSPPVPGRARVPERSASSSSPPTAACAAALNANVFKSALQLAREWQGKGAAVSLCVIGNKGLAFFRRLDLPILGERRRSRRQAARRAT